MTPEEILRDALAKIRCGLGADSVRLGQIRAEEMEIKARVAKGEAAEKVLLAAMDGVPLAPVSAAAEPAPNAPSEPNGEAPAPVEPEAPAQPDPKSEPVPQPTPAAAPASNFRPVEPAAAAEAIAAIAPASAQPEEPAGLPGPADPARDAAIQAAKALSPSTRTERHVRILAAAAVVRAFHTEAKATAARFGVHGAELAPSMLRKVGIVEDDVVAVAKAIAAKKTASAKPVAEAKAPDPASEKPAPEATPDSAAVVRDLANDLLIDLPAMLATTPAGVGATAIADWLGCTVEQAREAASLLIREGKAVAPNKLLRLPAGEAVPA